MNFAHQIKYSVVALAMSVSVLAPAAQAKEDNRDYITGYIGYFDVIGADNSAAQFGVEYRARQLQYGIRPTIGINATNDASVYAYAGFHWDVPLIDNQLYLIPSFVAGAYQNGDGKDLGGALEFRSGIELAYEFPNAHRLGVAFNHISNASLYRKNPGSETAMVTYSVPLDTMR